MSRATVKRTVPRSEVTPVKETAGALPAHLQKRMAKDSGKGISTAPEDNLVPLIYVLQDLSPQTKQRNSEYVKGAQPGMIWLRNASEPLVDGDDGILFQPCYFEKDWLEWVPRDSGGGFVARHSKCPKEAKRIEDPKNKNKVRFVMPNGNELVETRHHIGYVLDDDGTNPRPYVISMSSSGHTTSRNWMFMMNSVPSLEDGTKPPSFARLYRMKTKERTNVQGTWFVWDIIPDRFIETDQEYERGLTLHDAFGSGEKKIEVPVQGGTEDNEGAEEAL